MFYNGTTRRQVQSWEVKVNLSFMYRGVEVQIRAFLVSALDGGEWSSSRAGRFILAYSCRYPLDRPHSRSERDGKEKNPYSCQESNPDRPFRSLVTTLIELPQFPRPTMYSLHVMRCLMVSFNP
jgi:hypothetical protein